MKTDNAMHKMSITAPTAVKEAINMVSSDPSSGIEIVVELSVIVVLRDHPFKTLANFTLFLTHTPLPSALCNYYLKSIRANFTFLSHSEKLIHAKTHFLSHFAGSSPS